MWGWSRVLDATLEQHGEALYARAYALTGRTGSADQLFEDALVSVIASMRRLTPREVRNRAIRVMHRRLATHRDRDEEHSAGPALEEVAQAPEHSSEAAANAALHWNVRAAREYVAAHPARDDDALTALLVDVADLPDRERVCVVLRYLDGRAAPFIAEETGLSIDDVRTLLTRAVDRLALLHPALGLSAEDAAYGGHDVVQVEAWP